MIFPRSIGLRPSGSPKGNYYIKKRLKGYLWRGASNAKGVINAAHFKGIFPITGELLMGAGKRLFPPHLNPLPPWGRGDRDRTFWMLQFMIGHPLFRIGKMKREDNSLTFGFITYIVVG
jgi:hypothetical protein